jgi:hypothetical protein
MPRYAMHGEKSDDRRIVEDPFKCLGIVVKHDLPSQLLFDKGVRFVDS